ncbi:GMC family oxidoreductase [Aspergillus mulundensis]|uniref:Glucose-methanol-choline oxidoreductase N-terminal domain-containing protein n=1 Tax=Aspergillus mulundensis TaxID=1810919 RepID=A0A3D8QRY0_9EURO|nr:Uncharacterized protein DSM5745_09980 [Aspergillus mulundensis]RDW64569.1 Uncharacterized protein DSM5745_09980 [Aspergillus mulundensis]
MHPFAPLLAFLASFAVPSLALHHGPGINATYDYIVVGGGTSGLALAARLAEDPSISVAVVEAGGYYEEEGGPENVIPALCPFANTSTDPADSSPIDWNFDTLPLTDANSRVIRYARGKTLGGSSARNFMVYHRGTRGTYDQWAELTGDSSWSWESVLPYFKRGCTLTPPNEATRFPNTTVTYNDAACDPAGGPLHVTWPNYGDPFATWAAIGLEAIGMSPANDFNSGELNGTAWASNTIHPRRQIRESSETSYLRSALKTSTLAVYDHTMALRIDFEGLNAVGVQVKTAGKRYTLRARKEVIISAGAFQSPQLLMVSGIGPRSTLEPLGITVIADSPGVGQGMWDHPIFNVAYQVNVETMTRYQTDPEYAAQVMLEYESRREGPLTTPVPGILGWERLSESLLSAEAIEALAVFPDDWPMVEYISRGTGLLDPSDGSNGEQYAGIGTALVAPLSRGSISINSSSAEHPPLIDLGYLTHPVDREVAIAALKRTRQAFEASGVTVGDEYQPGPAVQTDEEILEYIRATISPVYHPAGTCVMGKATDRNAVVDSQARVIGVNNLRVVDASIFPALPPGHPQASCYMVAEKIADDILHGPSQ